jgi:hypothetical protein
MKSFCRILLRVAGDPILLLVFAGCWGVAVLLSTILSIFDSSYPVMLVGAVGTVVVTLIVVLLTEIGLNARRTFGT